MAAGGTPYYDPALVDAIKKQAPSTGYEEALLLGGFYETGIGTNPASYSTQGVPDPTWSSPSFGPFMWHYNTGALNDLMNKYGWTEQQAVSFVTTPSGAVSAALDRYEAVAKAQNINPNTPYGAMQLATAAEVGIGEQNALASGSWQSIFQTDVQPLLGKAGNQPLSTLTPPPSSSPPSSLITTDATASISSGTSAGSYDYLSSSYHVNNQVTPTLIGAELSGAMHPTLTMAPDKKNSKPGWSWNPITDAEHIWDDATSGVASIGNDIDRLAVNIWKMLVGALVRIGLVILGLGLVGIGLIIAFPKEAKEATEMVGMAAMA